MKQQAGFTLVEFMIANVLLIAVMAATFTLMNTVFTANTGIQQVLTTQQNLRVAMNTITRDITMAGTGLPDSGTPVPNGTNAKQLQRPAIGLACPSPPGTAPGCLPTPNNVLAILTPGDGVGPTVANVATDVLTISTIDQTSPNWVTTSITSSGTVVNFSPDIRNSPNQMFVKDLLLFNNANGSAFGCVTAVSTTQSQATFAANDVLNINQPTSQYGTIATALDNGDMPATYPPTTVTRVTIITYYIDNTNTQNPRLMRSVNGNTPQVMVEGIENLQISYDLFDYTNNTETSNQSTTTNPNQIRSVRVAINGHSPDKLKRTGDYYHFGLVSKVNVRNATFRNRYS